MRYKYRFDGTFAPERDQYYDVSNVVVDLYWCYHLYIVVW
jgi:isoamylase